MSKQPDPGLLSDLERGSAAALRKPTALWLADAVAAIGFAGGLAGAVSALAGQAAAGGAVDVATDAAIHALPWLALAAASAALRGVVAMGAARAGADASAIARRGLRQRVVAGALARPVRAGTGGELMQRAVDEVDAMDAYLARFLPARRAATVAPLLVLGAMACASPVAAGILLATLLPFVVLMALAGAASAGESGRQFAALARLSGRFADRLRALPVVLAFRAEAREAALLRVAAQEVAGRTLRVLRLAFLSSAVLEFFGALCVALVAVYAGFNLLGLLPFPVPEKLDLGRAFFVLAMAPEVYAPLRRLAAAYHDRQAASTAAGRLAPLAEAPPVPGTRPVFSHPPALEFDRVCIHYPDQPGPAVEGLSLRVRAGQTVAIVGPSGSGKSSLLRLLLGAAPLAGGGVRVDGQPLGDGIAPQAAWVGQSPLVVPGTLADNIALAWPAASRGEIVEAARLAGLEPMLAGRPLGLDAPVDPRGSGLSGGERRRLALARALLKPSTVWLLDEPTAHLDAPAETALIEAIARARGRRTTLIATHSEALCAIADVVVRLEARA